MNNWKRCWILRTLRFDVFFSKPDEVINPSADQFTCFTVDKTGITFQFQQYQTACYAEGSPKVRFEYGQLSSLFGPRSPVYQYVVKSSAAPLSLNKHELALKLKAAQAHLVE